MNVREWEKYEDSYEKPRRTKKEKLGNKSTKKNEIKIQME